MSVDELCRQTVAIGISRRSLDVFEKLSEIIII